MSQDEADLFRFEVPTSRGKFVIIGPDTLPSEEAAWIGAKIGKLVVLMLLNDGDVPSEPRQFGDPEAIKRAGPPS